MSSPHIRGIGGFLDHILTSNGPRVNHSRQGNHRADEPLAEHLSLPSNTGPSPRVRRGRPPGKPAASARKEKVTVWIPSNLIAAYRDWTWDARCQLSTLVQQAMEDYRNRR